jgi:hypothetical protein
MIHCGDVVDDGFAKQQWVFDLFAPSARLLAHVPAFPVIGNHEKNSHWYYDYFSLPKPEYFYTFSVGNAQFFMIDSNKDLSPGSDNSPGWTRPSARQRPPGSSPPTTIPASARMRTIMAIAGRAARATERSKATSMPGISFPSTKSTVSTSLSPAISTATSAPGRSSI